MDIDCVTNAQFEEFVAATEYKTEAELYGYVIPHILTYSHINISIMLCLFSLCFQVDICAGLASIGGHA
jgi:formylglycine-generating enzyme required for sulfatase activity